MRFLSRLSLISMSAILIGLGVAYFNWNTEILSAHIGKSYNDTVEDSTFSVTANTAFYPSKPPHPSSTWISKPVIIHFDDPEHGFTLPATKFGAIGFDEGKVSTMTTSPMLETLPFDQMMPLLNQLQGMLKDSGWVPRNREENSWLTLGSEVEKNALQKQLFDQVVVVMLLIPHKYSLALNVKCYARCNERDPKTAKYLIDVSVGSDYYSE
ncbi:hypothetical protein [Pseudomonas sp. PMCC200344]|uniref:hypothetical protein n=1 Tax=Pseudomonas sp. PMCC200344 TaxID=3042028 RepID=UPI0024B32609|nr:hypothetical protein [Pseudomonas sp. PMCC200344]